MLFQVRRSCGGASIAFATSLIDPLALQEDAPAASEADVACPRRVKPANCCHANDETHTLNKLLVLLAILVIEMGGGLSLAVGMALSDKALSEQTVHTTPGHSTSPEHPRNAGSIEGTGGVRTVHSPALSSRDRLLDMVRDAQGALRTGHRALGEALGISATRAGQLLRDLVADGAIRVRVGKTGSVITLVPIGH